MPAEPVTVPAGQEMDFPYPSRALGINSRTFATVPAAVGYSRELIGLGLGRWGLASLAADAELVVSELATNAVQAVGLTDPDATSGNVADVAAFHVRLLLLRQALSSRSGRVTWPRRCRRRLPASRNAGGGC